MPNYEVKVQITTYVVKYEYNKIAENTKKNTCYNKTIKKTCKNFIRCTKSYI